MGDMSVPKTKTFFNISSFQIIVMFRRGLFYSYLSVYLRMFLGLSVTETTLFATLPMIANVLCQSFIWGSLSDRLQLRRTLIIIGEAAAAIITSVVWYVHILPVSRHAAGYILIFGMTIVEIFWSMSNIAWSALLSDLYSAKERTGLQGQLASVGAAGRLIGILCGGLLYDGLQRYYDGWGFYSGTLFFLASITMMISTIPMFFVPEGGVKYSKAFTEPDDKNSVSANNNGNGSRSRQFTIFLWGMVFINFGINAINMLKPQFLALPDAFNISNRMMSYILCTGTTGIFLVGMMIKPASQRIKDETLLIVGCAVAIVYLLGYALADNIGMLFFGDFMSGAALAIIDAASYTYASRLIPAATRGKQFAIYNTSLMLSWGLPSTLITGPLVDYMIGAGVSQLFAYRVAFVTSSLMVAVGAAILIYNFRKNRAAQA